jgi:hypothetical protein
MAVYEKTEEELKGGEFTGSGRLRVDVFTEPWVHKTALVKKVMQIESLAREGAPAIFREECNPKIWPCPFFPFHPEQEREMVEGEEGEALLVLIEGREQARRMAAQYETERKAIDEQIVALIGEGKKEVEGWGVTTYRSGSSSTNWDAIGEKLGMDRDAARKFFTTQTKSDRLSVKLTRRED